MIWNKALNAASYIFLGLIVAGMLFVGWKAIKEVHHPMLAVKTEHELWLQQEHQAQTDFLVSYILAKECSTGNCGAAEVDSLAYGPAQFHRRTFNWMKGLAGRPQLQWKNGQDQRWLLRWALENGYGVHWGKNYYHGLRAYYERKQ